MSDHKYLRPKAWALLKQLVESETESLTLPQGSPLGPLATELNDKGLVKYGGFSEMMGHHVGGEVALTTAGRDYYHLNKLPARLGRGLWAVLLGAAGGVAVLIVERILRWLD